ncbi:permease-like cell division protein FtsX [Thermoactinospora rubra]|uniref:permease-like cell division protein FtsX n=1 Tax=Thermoactinospora rubra TaxID=1088767 RepID=UPI00117C3F6B|nr:permease-like cell division protein FtsX [Thermoactinospora rubra]
MNGVEERLREALGEAAATVRLEDLRPLRAPERARRRFRVDLRWAAAALLAGAAVGGGVTLLPPPAEQSHTAAVQPQHGMTVFFCIERIGALKCRDGAATQEQMNAVRRRLESLPEVQSVTFETPEQAYERFRRTFTDKQRFAKMTVADMSPMFHALLRPGADVRRAQSVVQNMPGVFMAVTTDPDTW